MMRFDKIRKGRFIERINRFVILCSLNGTKVHAYLPNPGCLWELLLPGKCVFLAKRAGKQGIGYTALAVERDGYPILLDTRRANDVAEQLLREGRMAGLEKAVIVRREITCGHSRFDFLLELRGSPFVLEVKSCTLFGNTIAMFPDAVTLRGRRHLDKMREFTEKGIPAGVIFIVNSPRVTNFLPDYHTDIEFAQTFMNLKNRIFMRAISVEWRNDLTLAPSIRVLEIPWNVLTREVQDGGCYLLILHIREDLSLDVGSLGHLSFQRGFYVYVGSARTNLQKRIARHLRKNKTMHWHIDYLNVRADSITALPVRTIDSLEHDLAHAMSAISNFSVVGFGSSDCGCPSHLFYMETNPLHSPVFLEVLLRFRIDRLEALIAGVKA